MAWRSSLALLAGGLLALAFSPVEWFLLAFVALVPLLVAVEGTAPRRAFLLGWLAGLFFFSSVLWWVTVAVITYGGLPAPVGWGVLLLMAAVLAGFFGCFAVVASLADRRGVLRSAGGVLLLAAAWAALEWLRGRFPAGGFPWALLAYTQYLRLPFIQSAALAGPWLPGFVVAAVNVGLLGGWSAIRATGRDRRRGLAALATAVVLLAADLGYGFLRLGGERPQGPAISVAVTQGNIPQDEKWDRRFREATIEAYEELTRQEAGRGADLVVWPEAATPFYYQREPRWRERIGALVRETGVPLLFGAPAYEEKNGRVELRNRAYYLDAGGEETGHYDKMHLVPFGEYVPFAGLLTFAKPLVEAVGNFTPGEKQQLFTLGEERFGTLICYEVVFPDLVRRFASSGATFLVSITNDAWYGRSSASRQHFTQMVFRAVETGLPIARAANTGISGFVEADGRVASLSPLFVKGSWRASLRPGRGLTPYARWGDFFPWLCLAGVAGWLATGWAPRLRRGVRGR